MATRTARTDWHGTLEEGSGTVTLASSGQGSFEVSFPRRAADDAQGVTSPEELVAAAHSSCFAMQFSALLAQAGGNPQALEITADVRFGPDPAGGFHIPGIKLTVRGKVDGLDAERFQQVAEEAKATCPVSKALAGTTITLDAALS
ncbi:OsmC family peroxiredoxin [Cellulomonas alba]|jgi:osmotically inducible protein OsmC|uniref:OsmC family peroxiredoxin n=1 Tax=Cellulomonas alba TaxID=3053467 RepID=A0ABT7SGL5_9CELL|nr:OsmC family peroxiredoxin [Cellulomonas alba]MDM7855338.1 OsmC family peroxiredoxin [Cellulomonas alba]